MSEAVIYQDERVKVTKEKIEAGGASYAVADVRSTLVNGGTAIEEKVFLAIIIGFGLVVVGVGVMLKDLGETALGLGLSLVTLLIILQKCKLRLVTDAGKVLVLSDRNVRYIRQVRDKVEEAMGRAH